MQQEATIDHVKDFWNANPCGNRSSRLKEREKYFAEIEAFRYETERHIPGVARFQDYRNQDVLEIGCGMGTDATQFAKNGARYTGCDLTGAAVRMSEERFALLGLKGRFQVADARSLPFEDNSFDHVYSWGVIHHSPETKRIVSEVYRVLRPGGTVCIMVYNRTSVNYYVEILLLRKIFRYLLWPKWAPKVIAKLTGFDVSKLERHREILTQSGQMTKSRWLSINTDGPDNPLSKVYGDREARLLFQRFENVRTSVWHFDKSHWPFVNKFISPRVEEFIGRKWGWHRVIHANKPC